MSPRTLCLGAWATVFNVPFTCILHVVVVASCRERVFRSLGADSRDVLSQCATAYDCVLRAAY